MAEKKIENISNKQALAMVNWIKVPGQGWDIGAGADGSVWLISLKIVGVGQTNCSPCKWNGHDWDFFDGAGVRIAVGPDGVPWMVDAARAISHRQGGKWVRMPGGGRDIGAGADGSVWLIGGNTVGSAPDSSPFKWNGHDWVQARGGGQQITVGPDGTPWLVNSVHDIYRASF